MPRLSIDITPEQHQKLKAIAALRGQSIKDYVLQLTLADAPDTDGMTEEQALAALSAVLQPRVEQAQRGEVSENSFEDIRRIARQRSGL